MRRATFKRLFPLSCQQYVRFVMEVNPLSIILVKSDSKGDRLLFRYPYEVETTNDIHDQRNGKKNPYALSVIEDLLQTPMPHTSNIHKGKTTTNYIKSHRFSLYVVSTL